VIDLAQCVLQVRTPRGKGCRHDMDPP
jgi:hypothetical protein